MDLSRFMAAFFGVAMREGGTRNPMLEQLFDAVDGDADGKISCEEYTLLIHLLLHGSGSEKAAFVQRVYFGQDSPIVRRSDMKRMAKVCLPALHIPTNSICD